ncbi:hypothetical protein G5714_006474 [Onychostoma macrolepis]|uniref:PLA2c domain-containing protein n=1 Tax=Onychostoma macrolepis TaxID=369639 RepID=A0A7J6D3X7_9TELE|nr:hypothetical protein G5714_006474 [Onychostoma macrolepis]
MSASKPKESGTVRFKPLPNRREQKFVASRRNTVLQTLRKLQIQCIRREVPNIALLGSGGGQRAMVGLLGSLVQLDEAGLLDCILYLSGVSGSTWCMASLYKEPDWSTKLETVKDRIIKRLSGPGVSFTDKLTKLENYYRGKDFFTLTDVWAVMVVTAYVKEIDEQTLADQWDKHNKDPYPIYAVIDKQCKQHEEGDPWFEISPHEAGYSLTGAFVGTSSFGSQFKNKMKKQDEMDMLYLQAMCSSALAVEEEIWKWIKDPNSSSIDECYQVLLKLVDMNLAVLKGADPSALDQSIRTTLTDISGGQRHLNYPLEKLKDDKTADKEAAKQYMKQYTMDVCKYVSLEFKLNSWPFDILISICRCIALWIWGRKYNFLHDMTAYSVPAALLESETRDYIDAGVLLNSPYFSVLRKERDIDLIISLDFSEDDSFTFRLQCSLLLVNILCAQIPVGSLGFRRSWVFADSLVDRSTSRSG